MEQVNIPQRHPAAGLPGQQHWQGWLFLLLKSVALATVISLLLMLLVAATATAAHANSGQPVPGPHGAALLLQTDSGPVAAPVQSTRVTMQVNGHLVRTRVAQTFKNPTGQWLHALYRFPLADSSAVDGLTMRVGDELIKGEIRPRQVARKQYEQARRQGKRASLVTQTQPNDFSARVANIAPGGQVQVEITFQQALALNDKGWTLRFPTVVAPRYNGKPVSGDGPAKHQLLRVGYAMQDDELALRPHHHHNPDTIEAAHDISAQDTAPMLSAQDDFTNQISFDIRIDAGMAVSPPESATHSISAHAVDPDAGVYRVSLTGSDVANRDFELNWSPAPCTQPGGSVQFERFDNQWFGLAVVAPTDPARDDAASPARELIFVIDTSGSMHGESIDQAVRALHTGLQGLKPTDRFNLIRFSNHHEALFRESVPASAANIRIAGEFLDGLHADGGTEMRGALERALLPAVPAGLMSQVVFVTDGAVSGEQALFNVIEDLLGSRRLFTVGIGSAPNDFFMKKAAAAGRGTYTMIHTEGQVQARMTRLLAQLARPVLTDLQLRNVNGEVLVTDAPIGDLYAGQPVVHTFRTPDRPAALFLEGRRNGKPWQHEIRTVDTTDSGIHKLWARDALDDFAARIRRPELQASERNALRRGATGLAMKHGLVSRYTSLVAVSHRVARPADTPAAESSVPRQLPKGWTAGKSSGSSRAAIGGSLATGSTGLWLELFTGSLLLLLALAVAVAFLMRAERLVSAEPLK